MKQDARSRSADSQQSFSGHTRRNHEGDRSHPSGTVREPDRDQGRDRATLIHSFAPAGRHETTVNKPIRDTARASRTLSLPWG